MTDEERKAIEKLQSITNYKGKILHIYEEDYIKCYIKTVLNLINKQEKAIDRMAEVIEECRQNDCLYSDDIDLSQIAGIKAIKEYFMEEQ